MKRYKHNLSHYRLLTCDMGELVPIACVEALPGDTIQHNTNALVRVSPLAAPVMHPVTARIHHFFVPNRIIWDGWEDFITGGPDGLNADTPPQYKVSTGNGAATGSLIDYLGVPPGLDGLDINELPIRAFNTIYNEYYRDQDLVPERAIDDTSIPKIVWEKDYFTTCRPWTQKGPDVTVPIGDKAPVQGLGTELTKTYDFQGQPVRESGGVNTVYQNATLADFDVPPAGQNWFIEEDGDNPGYPGIYADLANATGGDINDIRKAFAIQRYQEARARYGSRYTEYLRYLGVRPKDERLQRPEFLGGGRTQLNFSEIMQTANDLNAQDARFGVGDLYGHGIGAMRSNRYRRHIEEHGWIISLMSVRPKSIYQDGVHRQWLRLDKEDYFQKELQWIGQQEVFNSEVYADPSATGRQVFGYQDRYMDYRSVPSLVSAEFRDTLSYWHMARKFSQPPVLNRSFVECDATKRIHNEQQAHALWVHTQHRMVARRLVARNAAPRIL